MMKRDGNNKLSQSEADALIKLPKKKKSDEYYGFPVPGESLTIPLVSDDEREEFLIDINRGRIRLIKCSYQERYRTTIILVRLDVNGPDVTLVPLPYLTPYNGQTIECPHLHLFVEDYADRWAIPIPSDKFPDTADLYKTLKDFFYFCHVVDKPQIIQRRVLDEFK